MSASLQGYAREELSEKLFLRPNVDLEGFLITLDIDLSARELSIIQLAAKGFSNPEVAEMLGISVNSVKTHFRHIFEKMDVSDRMEAVTLAISRGIIER